MEVHRATDINKEDADLLGNLWRVQLLLFDCLKYNTTYERKYDGYKIHVAFLCTVITGIFYAPANTWRVALSMSVCPCIVDDMKRVKPTRRYTMVY